MTVATELQRIIDTKAGLRAAINQNAVDRGFEPFITEDTPFKDYLEGMARYFFPFNAVINSYGQLAAAFTPAGNFKVEIYFSSTTSSGNYTLFESDADTQLLFWIRDGKLQAYVGNGSSWVVSAFNGVATVTDGKWRKAGLSKVGSLYTIFLDNVAESTVTNATAVTPSVALVSRRWSGGNYFNGVLANPKLTDLDTPANSLEFKLNKATGEYELPVNNVMGSDKVVNGNFSQGTTGWTVRNAGAQNLISVVDSQLNFVGDGSAAFALAGSEPMALPVGEVFLITADIIAFSGAMRMLLVSGNAVKLITSTGKFEWLYTSTNGESNPIGPSFSNDANASVIIDNIKVQSVTNALLYNNIPQADRFQAQRISLDWVGTVELVREGDFSSSVYWTLQSGVTISGGKLVINSTQTFAPLATQNLSFTNGGTFVVEVKVSGYVQGEINVRQGTSGADNIIDITADGTYKLIFIGIGASVFGFRSGAGDTEANVEIVSVKRILEAPRPLFNSSGVLQCSGILSCTEIIPCGD
jgi:hypothetical protein